MSAGLVGFVASGIGQYLGIIDDRHGSGSRILSFGIASALIVYGAAGVEKAGGWRMPRWLQHTGDASYAIYLSHLPVLTIFSWSVFWVDWRHGQLLPHLGWLATLAIPTLSIGFALHFVVEQPLLSLFRRRRAPVEPEILRFAEYQKRAA